ncbi:MAG: epoxyqueuosine reductase QueH, partial [Alphaproteobacteria bacterium]|nr:epoxyqueuosine reductase QueH [Alphaproteobacteria bacterium]
MKLVLLSCCAPCSADMIYQLCNDGTEFVVLFYNPNIYPESEYILRRDSQIKLCNELGVKCVVLDGSYDGWLDDVKTNLHTH